MKAVHDKPAKCKRRHHFLRDRRGASALEFAIVAGPLILLLLAVLQVGYVYVATYALDGAVGDAARLIRTGQAQTGELDATEFKQELCARLVGPLSCGKLMLDVRSYDSFSSAANDLTAPFDDKGNVNNNLNFDPGNPEDVVIVRAFYPLELNLLSIGNLTFRTMQNMGDNSRMLVSTAAFRNEPYL